MKFLDSLERKCKGLALPNLTVQLLFGQVALWLLAFAQGVNLGILELVPADVMQGQIWRVISFLFVPPMGNPIFLIFGWYLFYIMGTALESYWGDFRYNIFICVGWLATIAASFIAPDFPATNVYIYGSVFLAFAYLNPEFELLLMFILPVKIKWLAMITWVVYFIQFATGGWSTRLAILAAVLNFFLFFGAEIATRMRYGARSMAYDAKRVSAKSEAFHRCATCGATERTEPDLQFLYCSQCDGAPCYCERHIKDHEHVKAKP